MREKLKQLRRDKKVTQEEVAKAVGISRSYYTNIEKGVKNPSLTIAFAIKDFFKHHLYKQNRQI